MNTTDFCEQVKNASDDISSYAKAKKLVRLVFDTAAQLIAHGESIRIDGFGTFTPVVTAARAGVNPRTGKKIQIPAAKRVKFQAAKGLKEMVKAES